MFKNRFIAVVGILSFLLAAFMARVPSAHAAGSAPAVTYHTHVPGVAALQVNTCPDFGDWAPNTDTFCEEWDIFYYLEGDPSDLRQQTWRLAVEHFGAIVHPDDSFTDVFGYSGDIENPQGSFDLQKYTSAQVYGTVPMSDGSEVVVDLTWNMALAELHHGGNNSIANWSNGIDPIYVDRCLTYLHFAHQQWRAGAPGQIRGSIGGVDVHSFFLNPLSPETAGRSVYTEVLAEHTGCMP